MRQAGAIQTDGLDETIDTVKALLYCKPGGQAGKPAGGRRMGLIAMTGGQSVVITDAFESEGLEVPLLTAASYEKLSSFFNIIGGSYRNPLDAGGTIGMGFVPGNLQKLFEVLEEDENVDAVAMEVGATFIVRRMRDNPAIMDALVETLAGQRDESRKPFLAIAHQSHVEDVMIEMRKKLLARGVAAFGSFQSAAGAFARASAYWQRRAE
jgi:acyl-CoA synthetase (NDP forming)